LLLVWLTHKGAKVVGTNWQNDYARKVEDCALSGIPEDWIVDHKGFGGREYIGKLKESTVSICQLVEELYTKHLFKGDDQLASPTFSKLQLPAEALFAADSD
jgi:Uma2 family endonuclease